MPRILVVEDEPLIAMMLADWLAEVGHEAKGPVHSVKAALSLLDETAVDAAVLDVTLGDEDSYAVADALAARGVPFAFATGHGISAVAPRYKGVVTLSKPFDFASVTRVLDQILRRTAHS